jgi:hypothetical protein
MTSLAVVGLMGLGAALLLPTSPVRPVAEAPS